MLGLGRRASRVGLALGFCVALTSHGAGAGRAVTALTDMAAVAKRMRAELHEFLWSTYDVDLVRQRQAQKPTLPEPEPEPLPPPKPVAPPKQEEEAYERQEPPPAPAQATEVLTRKEDGDEPVDLTDQGFVTGKGTGPGYGYVSAAGTAQAPTFDGHAQAGGTEGGKGAGAPEPPPKPRSNRSRPAGLAGGHAWDCPFPPEADAAQVDRAVAVIVVTVGPGGEPRSARVLSDPGYGFGRAARECALAQRFQPALDRDGNPALSTTPPIKVRFRR
ncbi:MAG: hypothetical protein HY744_16425 [Deltaproteobacteria bacterium]|nr:hypothetical protein [Deltaproteobacteria bacterium]